MAGDTTIEEPNTQNGVYVVLFVRLYLLNSHIILYHIPWRSKYNSENEEKIKKTHTKEYTQTFKFKIPSKRLKVKCKDYNIYHNNATVSDS